MHRPHLDIEQLQIDLAQKNEQIKDLQLQNELAKNDVILLIKNINRKDVLEEVESILEILLGIEKTIEVMRHECNEILFSSIDNKVSDPNFLECHEKIEKGIAKIREQFRDVNGIIREYRHNQTAG